MTEEMRRVCRTGATSCTRDLLQQSYHIGKGRFVGEEVEQGENCCHYHDLLARQTMEER